MLYEFLKLEVLPSYDVRSVLNRYFRLNDWTKYKCSREAVLMLYDKWPLKLLIIRQQKKELNWI